MSWPAVVIWALCIPMLFSRGPALFYVLNIVGVFASLQMLPGDSGGANLVPSTVYAVILVCKVAFGPGNLMRALESALDFKRLGLFTAFIFVAILSAVALPRMFGGLIEVIPVSGASLNGGSLLQPRSGNITQTCYMMISYLTALAFSILGSRADVRRHYLYALLSGGAAVIFTGILDLALNRLGLGSLLDPFRTATYALLTDVETAGVHRVVGLTPEASSYGTMCVSAAASILFLRPLYAKGFPTFAAVSICLGLAVMAALSTSATAFIGGGVVACLYAYDLMRRMLNRQALGRETLSWEVGAIGGLAITAFFLVTLFPERLAPLFSVLDKVIFEKTASLSYYQRSMWTRVGWLSFLDSGGLGVGLGSVRTSNWAISIIASTGLVGGFFIFGFVWQKLTASTKALSREDAAFYDGVRLTLIPFLAMSSLGGTIPDIGIGVAASFGLLSLRISTPSRRDRGVMILSGGVEEDAGPMHSPRRSVLRRRQAAQR